MATFQKRSSGSSSSSDSDSDHEPSVQLSEKPGLGALVITQQPGTIHPSELVNCPAGLEYLAQIDQLILKQKVHLVEVFCNWEKKNHFLVYNSMGQPVYDVKEESDCCQRQYCGNARAFKMFVKDNNQQDVMVLEKQFVCCSGCTCTDSCANSKCAWELAAQTMAGETLGYVRQGKFCCCPPKFTMLTADRSKIGEIIGPCCICVCPCCGDIEFPMYANDGTTVIGKIAKQWSGAAKELFTDAANFSATFPQDIDVRSKASIFAATFLIDMMYFERN